MPLPRLIELKKIGNKSEGYLSVASFTNLPFEIKRVFWTYETPSYVVRGNHAHRKTKMILVALNNRITVRCKMHDSFDQTFILDDPNIGLYMPPLCWHTMTYDNGAVQLVITDTEYDESDYIRDFGDFTKIRLSG